MPVVHRCKLCNEFKMYGNRWTEKNAMREHLRISHQEIYHELMQLRLDIDDRLRFLKEKTLEVCTSGSAFTDHL